MAKIFWCKCRGKQGGLNFGDMVTPYLYKKITGKNAVYCVDRSTKDPVFIGAGSIMDQCYGWKNLTIWGTGVSAVTDKFEKPAKILSVRGPLTRNLLLKRGISCPEVYGDIGLLLPRFFNPTVKKRYRVGLIPHYVDYERCVKLYKNTPSIRIINPCNPIEQVVKEILECWITASSSLHGIIVSHAYGIKCAWLRLSNKILSKNFKYLDYYGSVGIHDKLKPIEIRKKIEIETLVKLIKEYKSPSFPINTDHIMELCPFVKNT